MSEASIPVDLLNPGQVFACLGFLEAAEILLGNAEAMFEWHTGSSRFVLRSAGEVSPVEVVLQFLRVALPEWYVPVEGAMERDGGTTKTRSGVSASEYPRLADLAGALVGLLGGVEHKIPIGFWSDSSTRYNTTFQKSSNKLSSDVRMKTGLSAIRALELGRMVSDPFAASARTETLFRMDPRGSVDSIEAGFSPDMLRKGGVDLRVATFPICEVLAVLGFENARPLAQNSRRFTYSVWSGINADGHQPKVFLPPQLARAAICGGFPFLRVRKFTVEHDEVKKGGNRKFISIKEEK